MNIVADSLSAVGDLLFPALCPFCLTEPGPHPCPGCLAALPHLRCPCPHCGQPRWSETESCPACAGQGRKGLDQITIRWSYEGLIATAVRRLKGGADTAALAVLCRLLLPPGYVNQAQAVVGVPPAPGRRSGPHLARALARQTSRHLAIPCRRHLRCTRLAAPQHELSLALRQRNVEGLFVAIGKLPEHLLLVDDLFTSGATASAAALALRAGGARRVDIVCLARTPEADDPPAWCAQNHEMVT